MNKKLKIWSIWILVLVFLLIAASFFALTSGPVDIPKAKILSLLFAKIKGQEIISPESTILFNIRIPRILLGFMVGAALSLAGVIMQGMFRNPLVEPYTLGISGGAALAVSVSVVFGMDEVLNLPVVSCLGALFVTYLVYVVSNRWKGLRITPVILTGVMFSFICSSIIMLTLSVSRAYQVHTIIFWIMGSLSETHPLLLRAISVIIPVVAGYSIFSAHELNALSLGEEEAMHLGVDVQKTKKRLFILSSLLAGTAVSVSGIIGFVGLVVPHFIRMFVGSDHRILMPAAFLLGGIFLLTCDTVARTIIAPVELPVGVITGVVGGVIFIYFLIKGRQMIWKNPG